MDKGDTDQVERAVRAATDRLAACAASLVERMRESTSGAGPASDRYLDALETSLKCAQEYCRALTRLRDLLRSRLGR